MTEDLTALTERLAGLARAMAAPLPSPEEMAAGKEQDRAMAERIHKARPGIPLHHAYAVLETLRTIQRVEAAKAEAEPVQVGMTLGFDDCDPVATCHCGARCKGDSVNDALIAWGKHLTTVHRGEW